MKPPSSAYQPEELQQRLIQGIENQVRQEPIDHIEIVSDHYLVFSQETRLFYAKLAV